MSLLNRNWQIRPLDVRKDLAPAADLIEICFGSQLDPDGTAYLEQIRRAAKDPRRIRWVHAAGEMVSYPLNGYVCELDHQVIGNLSLIPFYWKREWYYLIANVAVHPGFRRLGIAHALTEKALWHLNRLPIRAVWLHVREDNDAALRLYKTFQFQERCKRDTWVSTDVYTRSPSLEPGEIIEPPRREDWPPVLSYLAASYPPEVAWNLGFDTDRYKPGLLADFARLFSDEKGLQWNLKVNGQVFGSVILEKTASYADHVFLGLIPGHEETALGKLLPYVKTIHSPGRKLLVNFPAHTAEKAFVQAGFELATRLIWMEIRING